MAKYKLDAVRVLLLLLLLPLLGGGAYACFLYASFRVARAKADIARARNTAETVLEVKEAIDQERDVLAMLGPLGEFVETVGLAAYSTYRSDAGAFEDAATDARHCEAEVTRVRGWLELLWFEQPTECRAMFSTLDEAPELADAGVTFGNAVAEVLAERKSPPRASATTACTRWEIVRVSFTAPGHKKGFRNPRWDVGLSTKPDVFIKLRVDQQKERRSPVYKDRFAVVWDVEPPVEVSPGQNITVNGVDKDATSDDHIAGYSMVWGPAIGATEVEIKEFKLGTRCAS